MEIKDKFGINIFKYLNYCIDVETCKSSAKLYQIALDSDGNAYAAGNFSNKDKKHYVAKWNGSSWSELGAGAGALNAF